MPRTIPLSASQPMPVAHIVTPTALHIKPQATNSQHLGTVGLRWERLIADLLHAHDSTGATSERRRERRQKVCWR
jgi:hypothetical protein